MIQVKNVSKTYNKRRRNANQVLDNTSIQLPDSGFVFFVGRSGSGKSTILNAIGGLISYEGEILFDKEKVNLEKYRQKNIGYVFQNFLLFDDQTILENIRVPLNLIGIYNESEIRERATVLLRAVDLQVNINRRVQALSLGQRQRVAIARALASNPNVILADEPTGNLDSKNSIIVMNILKKLSMNHLVICVTHNLGLVNKYADTIFQIQNKKLIELDKSKSEDINLASVTQNINVSKMTQKEFTNGDFLVKLYSQDAVNKDEVSEIKIIRQNGKILVVGDNISIVSKEEVDIANSSQNATDTEINEESLNDSEVSASSQGIINLDFENIEEKKTYKDWYLYKSFLSFTKASTKNFKTFLVNFSNAVFPLILFILFSIMIGQINVLTNEPTIDYHENYVTLASQDNIGNLYPNELANIISDENSHIVGTRNTEYSYSLLDNAAWDKRYSLGLDKFSFYNDIISNLSIKSNASLAFNISNVEQYSSFDIAEQFDNYALADGELLIDQSLLDQINDTLGDPTFIYQKTLEQTIIDDQITLDMYSWDSTSTPKTYKIVGIVDTDYPSFYANKKTDYQMSYYLRNSLYSDYGTSGSFPIFSDSLFSDYTFVNFSDLGLYPNYTFVGTSDYTSTSTYDIPQAFFSKAMIDNNASYPWILGECEVSSTGYIEDSTDPDAQIICYKDYITSSGYVFDSSNIAFADYVQYLTSNCNVSLLPNNLIMKEGEIPSQSGDLILPYSLHNTFSKSRINYLTNNSRTITGYYDDSSTSSKDVYTTPITYLATKFPSININYSQSPEFLLYQNTYVMSDDVQATIEYFENSEEHSFECFAYDDLYKEYNSNELTNILSNFVQSIVVALVIFLIITILSNLSIINKNKAKYGILRCLGYSKWNLIKQNSGDIAISMFYYALIPCAFLGIMMGLFNVYTLGFLWSIVFFGGYAIIMMLTSNLPLLFLLRKKPVEIINSLN